MKRVLLIDGDVLVYKTAWASEQVIDWGDDMVTLHSNKEDAADSIDYQLAAIKADLKGDELVVALTCHQSVNFRKEFYPQYKENRAEKRKPLVWKAMRDHLLNNHTARVKPTLEADDVLGILATKLGPIGPGLPASTERIIVSIDKDFKTIPCKFYNMNSKELSEVSEPEADLNFMVQTLTGDSTDNYPGCPGLGPKRAERLLRDALAGPRDYTDLEVMWGAVVKAFALAGFGAEYALTQARCARILRASDYDMKNKQPILWSPPK